MTAGIGTQVCNFVFSKDFCNQFVAGSNFLGWATLLGTAAVGYAVIKAASSRTNTSSGQRPRIDLRTPAEVREDNIFRNIITPPVGLRPQVALQTVTDADGYKRQEDVSWNLKWVEIVTKERLERTLIDGIPIMHWACFKMNSELLRLLINKGLSLPQLFDLLQSARSDAVLESLLFLGPEKEEWLRQIEAIATNPPSAEELEKVERMVAICMVLVFQSNGHTQIRKIRENWPQLVAKAPLYANWSAKTKEEQEQVFVEVFNATKKKYHLVKVTKASGETLEVDLRDEHAFDWVLEQSKEQLQQTTINGFPIFPWAILHLNSSLFKGLISRSLLKKLISRGFTLADARRRENYPLEYLFHQFLKMPFPSAGPFQEILQQAQAFAANPPSPRDTAEARRITSIFAVAAGQQFLHFFSHKFGRTPTASEMDEEEVTASSASASSSSSSVSAKPTYTITHPDGSTSAINKHLSLTRIKQGPDGKITKLTCRWDVIFNWVLTKSKAELEQTLVDGIPIFAWAILREREKTLIAKLISRGFTLEDLQRIERNLWQHDVQSFIQENQSKQSALSEQLRHVLELGRKFTIEPPEKSEVEKTKRTVAILGAIILPKIAEDHLRKAERYWT